MEAILGKWEMEDANEESMKPILRKMGVPEPMVAVYASARFSLEYQRDGDGFLISLGMPGGMNKQQKFRFGEQFDAQSLDGQNIKSVISEEGGRLVERHVAGGATQKSCEMTKEVVNGQLVATTAVEGLTGRQIFKRVV